MTVVRAISETDPWNKIRSETWVLLNETGQSVKAGPLESDATVAVVGLAPDGTIQNRAAVGGTRCDSAEVRRMARGQEAATGAGGNAEIGRAQTKRIQFCRTSR